MTSDITASISARQSRKTGYPARAQEDGPAANPVGPISLGGAPLTLPSADPSPQS